MKTPWKSSIIVRGLGILLALVGLAVLGVSWMIWASQSKSTGVVRMEGLVAPIDIEFDNFGIPRILANSREDAFRALGFVTARDRLFQMDLFRRRAAGRLAEVLGPELSKMDRQHRVFGFSQIAERALAQLHDAERAVLIAYAEGVNEAVGQMRILPLEFLALGYEPDVWHPEDSLLVILGMHESLNWTGGMERMATIMDAFLPKSVFSFFTPPLDGYTGSILNGKVTRYIPQPIPVAELSSLLTVGRDTFGLVNAVETPKGSNGWVVGPTKTLDGKAMLANDMHLGLSAPNIWYRAEIHYNNVRAIGFTLPGVPMIVSGSNGSVAWGFTAIEGDFVDLVSLEVDPSDPERYLTPQGFERFGSRQETIHVRGGDDEAINVRTTMWGPVLQQPLLGHAVAVHWTALDPSATDLSLLNLDNVADVHQALAILNRAGVPPLNALVADRDGNIAWSLAGKIPRRFGLNGMTSHSWADGARGWNGYIQPADLPRIVNPPAGFIVNANQRMVDGDYPYVIGHYFRNGYRAYRITERLADMQRIVERDLLNLQLDTRVEAYRFYQQLALSVLHKDEIAADAETIALMRDLESWDGFAERDSSGLAVILEFRNLLADEVISPFMAGCRRADDHFKFGWPLLDEPLQRLLTVQPPELLPDQAHYANWDTFLRSLLRRAYRQAMQGHRLPPLERLAWGKNNLVAITHPFSASFSSLQRWLDMPREPLPGCPFCVRFYEPGSGASERLVVEPGRESNGILHMPGGQSGHPFSPHYRDQQQNWVDGIPTPLLTGETRHRLQLVPTGAPLSD